jgi:MoaA/NifB/PqqE/SkfB family radical SAM enzyme
MVPKLIFRDERWDVVLPSIRAFTFTQEEISTFIKGNAFCPYVFDTNLVSTCNTNCVYCATQGGKSDVRYNAEQTMPLVSDDVLKELVPQFSATSVRTFFICSNGEPLLDIDRFLRIVEGAQDVGLQIITYTNGTTLNPYTLKKLHRANVNLVMKLESLNPKKNNEIILNTGGKRKKEYEGYKYGSLEGEIVPTHVIDALTEYSSDSDMLALETMLTRFNLEDALDIRKWTYEKLGLSQFLKHLYNLGYVEIRGNNIKEKEKKEAHVAQRVIALDQEYGMKYPDFRTPDHYSYDARRLMNNITNATGFPFRMFAHERGGVYHSSQIVGMDFGFGTSNLFQLVSENKKVDFQSFLQSIGNRLNEP